MTRVVGFIKTFVPVLITLYKGDESIRTEYYLNDIPKILNGEIILQDWEKEAIINDYLREKYVSGTIAVEKYNELSEAEKAETRLVTE